MRNILAVLGRHKVLFSVAGAAVLFVAVATVLGQLGVSPVKDTAGQPATAGSPTVSAAASSPAPVAGSPATAPSSSAPAAVASSSAALPPPPPKPSPAPSVLVSDHPAFDLAGSGDACKMNYFQDDQGRTVTLFDLAQDGELITHVSGPPGIGRHDQQETRGASRIVYDFPLSQATDMGAVLYLPDGTSQSCTIAAGSTAP